VRFCLSVFCLFVISYNYYNVYVQATSFDGVFLLVALHYIALVAIIFLLWLIKYLSIYPSTLGSRATVARLQKQLPNLMNAV